MSSDTCTGKASIIAGKPGESTAIFILYWSWEDPETEISTPIGYVMNGDASVSNFRSKGALGSKTLDVIYRPSDGSPYGFQSFKAQIGAGKIYLETGNLKVQGEIEGGPDQVEHVSGAGTWSLLSFRVPDASEVRSLRQSSVWQSSNCSYFDQAAL
jgi:hypothetical protein